MLGALAVDSQWTPPARYLDGFARSVSHLLRALETFRALGVEFVSLSEQVDTSTLMGKMVFTVLAAVAELERSIIVERVRAGLRNARAKGKRLRSAPGFFSSKDSGAAWPTFELSPDRQALPGLEDDRDQSVEIRQTTR